MLIQRKIEKVMTWVGGVEKQIRPSGWNFDKWSLAQTSKAISGNRWGGISLNNDGTKMFLTRGGSQGVTEYNLISPYDISSFTQVTTKSVENPEGLFFKPDGTKMYTVSGEIMHQFTLSTPRSIATATANGDNNTGYTNYRRGINISNDGTRVFLSNHTQGITAMATLDTPRDITTRGTRTTYSGLGGVDMWFGDSGKYYISQQNESTANLTIKTLSTPYNLSTIIATKDINIGVNNAIGLWFSKNGKMCFTVGGGYSTNYVRKYVLE